MRVPLVVGDNPQNRPRRANTQLASREGIAINKGQKMTTITSMLVMAATSSLPQRRQTALTAKLQRCKLQGQQKSTLGKVMVRHDATWPGMIQGWSDLILVGHCGGAVGHSPELGRHRLIFGRF